MSAVPRVPDGYEAFEVGGARVTARHAAAAAVRIVMRNATLHEWAAQQPGAEAMAGRATAWATTLPGGMDVVVRHSRHGGLLAPLTGDLFLRPTRARRELSAALRLTANGVHTADIVAYAVYPVAGLFARADVATSRLRGRALPEAWAAAADDAARGALVQAVAALLAALSRADAHHPDLNVSNILILDGPDRPVAAVLDVDRVEFRDLERLAVGPRNLRRLLRSIEKRGISLSTHQLAVLQRTERGA